MFVLDSRLTADGTDVDLTLSTFPHLESLVGLIGRIDVETDVTADTVADERLTDGV